MNYKEYKNVEGERTISCGCDSFIYHWERSSGKATICSNIDCNNTKDLVGAHIERNNSDDTEYIVPLCKVCNNYSNTEIFKLKEGIVPISPSKNNQCNERIVWQWEL